MRYNFLIVNFKLLIFRCATIETLHFYMYQSTYLSIYLSIYLYVRGFIYIYIYVCVCVCVCVGVCRYICIYIYIYNAYEYLHVIICIQTGPLV